MAGGHQGAAGTRHVRKDGRVEGGGVGLAGRMSRWPLRPQLLWARGTATSREGRRAAACTTCVGCHPGGESVGGICCSPFSSRLKFCGSHANELSSQIKQEIGLAPTPLGRISSVQLPQRSCLLLCTPVIACTHRHTQVRTHAQEVQDKAA